MPEAAAAESRILVVGPSWVGDMVMAQSLFKALHQRSPGCHIGVLAPAWTTPLLARMPEVAEAFPADLSHGKLGIGERLSQARKIRQAGYDQAIVLPRSLKSSLVPWLARIPRRTAYLGEMRYGLINDVRPLAKDRLPLNVQRFVALAAEQGADTPANYEFPSLQSDPVDVEASLARLGLELPSRPVLGLCPGAEYGPAKQWPGSHFAELAKMAIKKGFLVWLFGSDKDRNICLEIERSIADDGANLCGRTSLSEAIDLMSVCHTVVSNDSGLMHVAAALGKPVVVLYGSSSPGFTPPLSKQAQILNLELDCSPCFKRECPLQHLNCLTKISAQQVYSHIDL
ncbi:MAG: heptosyltransferase-2 [Parasphingorhabdus sp.]|jgi:heptosyltransferase-2